MNNTSSPQRSWRERFDVWVIGELTAAPAGVNPRTWREAELQARNMWWCMGLAVCGGLLFGYADSPNVALKLALLVLMLCVGAIVIYIDLKRIRLLDELEQLVEWRSYAYGGIVGMAATYLLWLLNETELVALNVKWLFHVLFAVMMLSVLAARRWLKRRFAQ